MNFKRNKVLNITLNIVVITFFLMCFVINYQLLIELKYYYLFVTLPMLFLSLIMILSSIIKLLLIISSLIFGRHDNDEVSEYIEKIIKKVNNLTKYILIGIFTTLLTSVMILDIILCVAHDKYLLVALSIVVWILLYYILFKQIVRIIRKEIRL